MTGNVVSWQNLSPRFSNSGCHENINAARQINCAASFPWGIISTIGPLLLRRPKVVFFGAQVENLILFFSRRRLVMVFGGQITFSTPPQNNSALKCFFRPPKFFGDPTTFFGRSQRITQPDMWAPALGPQPIVTAHFRLPTHVILVLVRVSSIFICAFHRYRPPNEKWPKEKKSAWAGDQSAFVCFFGAPKNRRFSAPKTKNLLFRRAPKEQRPKYYPLNYLLQCLCFVMIGDSAW